MLPNHRSLSNWGQAAWIGYLLCLLLLLLLLRRGAAATEILENLAG